MLIQTKYFICFSKRFPLLKVSILSLYRGNNKGLKMNTHTHTLAQKTNF